MNPDPSFDGVTGATPEGPLKESWPPDIAGPSRLAGHARDLARRAAHERGRALIVAETGFNPEAIARAAHAAGSPEGRPFVAVDCAWSDVPVEDLLFGRSVARAASSRRLESLGDNARIADADGGTLFLDNVSDLPASAQARLAHVVRDGAARSRRTKNGSALVMRVLASCTPTIDLEVETGVFRPDLYRRLGAIRIDVPPLRFRPEDVAPITRLLSRSVAESIDRAPRRFTGVALGFLSALPWEGNIAELRAVLERLADASPSGAVRVEDLLVHVRLDRRVASPRPVPLRQARRDFEREYIAAVLHRYGGRMGDAAQALGIQRTNLYRKARELRIPRVKGGR